MAEEASLAGSEGDLTVRSRASVAGSVGEAGGAGVQTGDALVGLAGGSAEQTVAVAAFSTDIVAATGLTVIDVAGEALSVTVDKSRLANATNSTVDAAGAVVDGAEDTKSAI